MTASVPIGRISGIDLRSGTPVPLSTRRPARPSCIGHPLRSLYVVRYTHALIWRRVVVLVATGDEAAGAEHAWLNNEGSYVQVGGVKAEARYSSPVRLACELFFNVICSSRGRKPLVPSTTNSELTYGLAPDMPRFRSKELIMTMMPARRRRQDRARDFDGPDEIAITLSLKDVLASISQHTGREERLFGPFVPEPTTASEMTPLTSTHLEFSKITNSAYPAQFTNTSISPNIVSAISILVSSSASDAVTSSYRHDAPASIRGSSKSLKRGVAIA